jgi:phenolic acid decarboxylase
VSTAPAARTDVGPAQDFDGIVGKHIVYRYENGWRYDLYVKNASTMDYRVHDGLVGGRWVRDQEVTLTALRDGQFRITWTEPTGTCVTSVVDLRQGWLHGVAFFPHWIEKNPSSTVLYQNDHLAEMERLREAGPTYPYLVLNEFARITSITTPGADDESVVACSPEHWQAQDPVELRVPDDTPQRADVQHPAP